MTCGIYLLSFTGTSKVYIGQSTNIERRYAQHLYDMVRGTSSPKVYTAYKEFGKPSLCILVECTKEELDGVEDEAIDIWNSVALGFNTYSTANEAPTNSGFGSGNSKYTKESIIKSFLLLVHTDTIYKDIALETDVSECIISKIASLELHCWLEEEYPVEYLVLKNKKCTRKEHFVVVSDKLSAKNRGIIYPKILSPVGIIYQIDNAYKFAKDNSLAPNHFQEVLNGHRKSHKGWKLCPVEPR